MQTVPRYDTDKFTALDKWQTVHCAAHLEMLDEVARLDRSEEWTYDGAVSMANWLVNRYNLSHHTAAEWVRVANALQELPAIRCAYGAGRMSWDQVRTATRFALPAIDDELAELAPDTPVRELSRVGRTINLSEVEQIHRERSFTWKFDEEHPVLWFKGKMVASDGVELVKTITRLANQAPPQPDGTYEPFEARCLDALTTMASHSRGADTDPDRATGVVHIPLSVLTNDEGQAECEDGTPILAETARRLMCDARLQITLDDDELNTIGIGRTARTIPPWLGRLLRKRDGGCRFPGCGRTRWIHFHHLIHWAHGGPTDLDNLISLCLYHHRLIHEGGWAISGDPNREITWIMPGGTPFVPGSRYKQAAASPIMMLNDFSVPEHLRTPDPPDTS
jgi:hypothetical protein